MISKILKGAVIASVFAAGSYGVEPTIKTAELHGSAQTDKRILGGIKNANKVGKVTRETLGLTCGDDFVIKGHDFKHGAYWVEKGNCKRHYSNIIPASKAYRYGVYYGTWRDITKGKTEYTDTKTVVEVSNRCYFTGKFDGTGGLKRSEWKRIGDNKVELHIGNYSYKGDENELGDDYHPSSAEEHKKAWNIFNSPLNCSEVPQHEKWTVYQKIDGKWQITARQTFIINP